VRGPIVSHTAGGAIEPGPGDKMVLPPHTAHAATAGASGVRCIEASRQQDQNPADAIRHVTDMPDDLSWLDAPHRGMSGRPRRRGLSTKPVNGI